MPEENRVSIELTEEQKTNINNGIDAIESAFEDRLIALSKGERQQLPKMSDKTIPFVDKTLAYVKSNPEFAPPYMDSEELDVDFQAVKDLNLIYNRLFQLISNLDDTIMLSGSEAYVTSLQYYNTVKVASRMNIPGAKVIYEDLKTRFPGSG